MATWTSAELTSDELARIAADKSLFVGGQVVEDAIAGRWVGAGGTIASAETTDSDYPVRFGYDRRLHVATRVDTLSSGSDHYLIYQLPAGGKTISAGVIAGHNFSGVANLTVSLMISDDGDFTGGGLNVETIASWATPFTSHRLVTQEGASGALGVKHTGTEARRYSAVEYVALRVNLSAGSMVPWVGELWLGDVLPMRHKPNRPHSPDDFRTLKRVFESDDGHKTNVIHGEGQKVMEAGWEVNDAGIIAGLEAFGAAMSYGGDPFLFWENPGTDPDSVWLMDTPTDRFALPDVNVDLRDFALAMTENAPFLVSEV